MLDQGSDKPRDRRPAHRRLRIALPALLVMILVAAPVFGLAFAHTNPDAVPAAVDWVRNRIGPGPVAAVENVYYSGMDVYNRLRYQWTGSAPSWTLAATPTPVASPAATASCDTAQAGVPAACIDNRPAATTGTSTPFPVIFDSQRDAPPAAANNRPGAAPPTARVTTQPQHPSGEATGTTGPEPIATRAAASLPQSPPPALTPLIADGKLPGEGIWRPLSTAGQPAGQGPILWQTIIRPDPQRPFAHVALVAMDLSRSQLHIVVGTSEPASAVPAAGKRAGMIPSADVNGGKLLAAWNGGFRAVHGHFGMMTDNTLWLPAIDGLQTVAIARDGGVTMGAWGRGVPAKGDWLAWRQNDPPLIEAGKINPDVITYANTIRWGASIDGAVFIWRSGMGLAQDGRWLIYAAGNSLSAATLTAALQAAGCQEAMQLDVNATYERFVTFTQQPQTANAGGSETKLSLTSQKLIDQMQGGPTQFLAPDSRDFFYLTGR
jgi:hypothetical protein